MINSKKVKPPRRPWAWLEESGSKGIPESLKIRVTESDIKEIWAELNFMLHYRLHHSNTLSDWQVLKLLIIGREWWWSPWECCFWHFSRRGRLTYIICIEGWSVLLSFSLFLWLAMSRECFACTNSVYIRIIKFKFPIKKWKNPYCKFNQLKQVAD